MPEEQYPLGPDSERQEGIPQGVVTRHTWTGRVFPGTTRDYRVYVPAQYGADKPACVMVFQDGVGFVSEESRWRVPIVFDNLIAQGAMPVTIGIFVNPGVIPSQDGSAPLRVNRSFEYDSVSDRYAQFLLDEILSEVGKQYNLSNDPNDRAIGGASSGGICAFTVAWFRPDAFRRVLSFIGSFTNLRGGDVYPSLIRKTEAKPLRVFLQSGRRDMNTYAGNWYLANQHLMSSFEYMGYDARLVLGDGGHDGIQGSSILPDALRWLWRDYPQPITRPRPPEGREWATDIVDPDSTWEQTDEEFPVAQDPLNGALQFVTDAESRWVWSYRVQADGTLTDGEPFYRLETADESSATGAAGVAVDADGRVYVATNIGIQVCDGEGRVALILANPPGGPVSRLALGGPDARTLYATAGNQAFRRQLVPIAGR